MDCYGDYGIGAFYYGVTVVQTSLWEEYSKMKRTIRDNINAPYTLHDMSVYEFEIFDNDIVMKTQSGIVEITPLCRQVEGCVEFHNV